MTKIVYKQTMESYIDFFDVSSEHFMPLKVGMQNDKVTLWYETSPNLQSTHQIKVRIVPTGVNVPAYYTYFDTVFDREFVWHIYYKNNG